MAKWFPGLTTLSEDLSSAPTASGLRRLTVILTSSSGRSKDHFQSPEVSTLTCANPHRDTKLKIIITNH